ncbi:MAG: hypothetical protein JNK16_02600 [Phycisphaerales bacterium]|nr:hypothetical protein [Phycisphaerales bacterium]
MNQPTGATSGGDEIQKLQESIAFLERRFEEYAAVTDELSERLQLAHKRIAALESGAAQLRNHVDRLTSDDQSGPGQPA